MGSGNCSFYAPATFDLGDDGKAIVIDPAGDTDDKINTAAKGCPTQAIFVNGNDEPISVSDEHRDQ
jgi:ferredoxin